MAINDIYLETSYTFEAIYKHIEQLDNIRNKDELHIIQQWIVHTILSLDIIYYKKINIEKVMKGLVQKRQIKHINDCQTKEDYKNFCLQIMMTFDDLYNYNKEVL